MASNPSLVPCRGLYHIVLSSFDYHRDLNEEGISLVDSVSERNC